MKFKLILASLGTLFVGCIAQQPPLCNVDGALLPSVVCSQFYECSHGVAYLMNCPRTLHFNPNSRVCDWPRNAGCVNSETTTEQPITTEPDVTSAVTAAPLCNVDGALLPSPVCSQYYACSHGIAYLMSCPSTLYFNPNLKVCDWPKNTGCVNEPEVTTTDPPSTTEEVSTTESPTTTTARRNFHRPAGHHHRIANNVKHGGHH